MGKGVHDSVLCWGGCPFLGGPLIRVVYTFAPSSFKWAAAFIIIIILVKVERTHFVLSGVPLVWWFQLEVLEKPEDLVESETKGEKVARLHSQHPAGGQSRAGKFHLQRRKHEMSLCKEDMVSNFMWFN